MTAFKGKVVDVAPAWKGPSPDTDHRRQVVIDFAPPAPDGQTRKVNFIGTLKKKRHRYDADAMRHTMTVGLEDAKFLDGLVAGDLVEGEAKVIKIVRDYGTSTDAVITNCANRSE